MKITTRRRRIRRILEKGSRDPGYDNRAEIAGPDRPQKNTGREVVFASPAEKVGLLQHFRELLPPYALEWKNRGTMFEAYETFDFLSVDVPEVEDENFASGYVEVYFSRNKLIFISEPDTKIRRMVENLTENHRDGDALHRVLHRFFHRLTEHDADYLEDLEDRIADLEDELAHKNSDDYADTIGVFRKQMLALKRYYESLVGLMEGLEENKNRLISREDLRLFLFQANRTERLYNEVLNLRDYITQVREAWQNQTDIRLNETMKLLTVITVVFTPLSFIAAWYGMNLDMPELRCAFAYPAVIVVTVIVAALCIVYFRRHRWF